MWPGVELALRAGCLIEILEPYHEKQFCPARMARLAWCLFAGWRGASEDVQV